MGCALTPMTDALIRRGEDREREEMQIRPCEDKGKDWSDIATRQGTPAIAKKSRS